MEVTIKCQQMEVVVSMIQIEAHATLNIQLNNNNQVSDSTIIEQTNIDTNNEPIVIDNIEPIIISDDEDDEPIIISDDEDDQIMAKLVIAEEDESEIDSGIESLRDWRWETDSDSGCYSDLQPDSFS